MVRTKYLLIAILLCLASVFGAGFFAVSTYDGNGQSLPGSVIFAVPQESYGVERSQDIQDEEQREEFISKVRDSIQTDPVVAVKRAPPATEDDHEESTPSQIQPEPTSVTPTVVTPPPPATEPTPVEEVSTSSEETPVAETPNI